MTKKTLIMGILNVTPDSFSDGGDFFSADKAIEQGLSLLKDGADILDIGGFSTFFAKPVTLEEEIKRVLPVVKALTHAGIKNISVDTKNSVVAQMCLDLGVIWINDQSAAMADENMPLVMAKAQKVVLMHSLPCESGVYEGEKIKYANVVFEVKNFFKERINFLQSFGVKKENIILDPGIGFGKGLSDSIELIKKIAEFNELGCTTLLGLSRKSFIGKITGIETPKERDYATIGANAAAMLNGVGVLRTHNVKAFYEFKLLFEQLRT